VEQHTVRRLAFVRYLYQTAVSQSRAPAPLRSASLLAFHDAVEFFLELACEQLNAGTAKPGFMEYWDIINPALTPQQLTQSESMRRLNRARVALKHHGTFPSDLDIEAFRACTTSFFDENTPVIFGVRFSDVSLADFVTPGEAALLLKEAQSVVASDPQTAAAGAAAAYGEMVQYHRLLHSDGVYPSPFCFGKDLTFYSSFHMNLDGGPLAEYIDRMRESVDLMRGAMETLTLGIDYLKYARFKSLVPAVHKFEGRADWVPYVDGSKEPPTQEDAQFCIDFVVESAIVLESLNGSLPNRILRGPTSVST
jgi:hypothetical protein